MLSWLPRVNEGESLYSILARLSDALGLTGDGSWSHLLWGGRRAHIPSVLHVRDYKRLIEVSLPNLKSVWPDLIRRHTAYRAARPFMSPAMLEKAEAAVEGADINRFPPLPDNNGLRLCALCLEADLAQGVQPYWHLTHQLPSVVVCHVHGTTLQYCEPPRNRYVSAATAVAERRLSPLEVPRDRSGDALEVARGYAWLLAHSPAPLGRDALHQALLRLTNRPSGDLFRTISATADQRFGVIGLAGLRGQQRIPRKRPDHLRPISLIGGAAADPGRLLLALTFVGVSVEQLFAAARANSTQLDSRSAASKPDALRVILGRRTRYAGLSAPCINPVCPVFEGRDLRALIAEGFKHALIDCPVCQMQYTRPVRRITRPGDIKYKRRGGMWDRAFVKLASNPDAQLHDFTTLLGLTRRSVRFHAQRLEVDEPESSAGTGVAASARFAKRHLAHLEKAKEQWLAARRDAPTASRSELRASLPKTYYDLYTHAREWLFENSPERLAGPNWAELVRSKMLVEDEKLLPLVKAAVARLQNLPGVPKEISSYGVARELGLPKHYGVKLRSLPRCAAVVASAQTPLTMFMRRLEWQTHKLSCEDQPFTLGKLRNRLHIKADTKALFEQYGPLATAVAYEASADGRTLPERWMDKRFGATTE